MFSKLFGKKKQEQSSILTMADVKTQLETVDKYQAIKMTGEMLVQKGCVSEDYIQAMLDREEIVTTYIGEGVAIPHGVGESKEFIKKSGIVVLQFKDGVDFDGEKAYLVVGIAGKGEDHLPILQSIAEIMMEEEVIEMLRTTSDSEFIYNTIASKIA